MLVIICFILLMSVLFYSLPTSTSIESSPLTIESGVTSSEELSMSTTLIPQEVLTLFILLLIFSPLIYKLIKKYMHQTELNKKKRSFNWRDTEKSF